jgi:hypothetical protein
MLLRAMPDRGYVRVLATRPGSTGCETELVDFADPGGPQ